MSECVFGKVYLLGERMELDFRALLAEERKKAALKSAVANDEGKGVVRQGSNEMHQKVSLSENTQSISVQLPDGVVAAALDGGADCASPETFSFQLIDDLAAFKLHYEYESIFYIPDYIDAVNEAAILSCIDESPWTILKTRRLQCYDSSRRSLPSYLQDINRSLVNNEIFGPLNQPNHVLINDYKSNEGILHHVDGPSYYPKVAILSMRSPCLMTFRPNLPPEDIGNVSQEEVFSVYLEPRSLLIFDQLVYTDLQHGIHADAEECDVNGRIPCLNNACTKLIRGARRTSLTIRRMYTEKEM